MKYIKEVLEKLNIEANDEMISAFDRYMEGILMWNEKVNLTSITDEEEFEIKHFIDSVITVDYPEFRNSKKIIDVGTGGGFPGMPLAIVSPDKEFVLMDSLNKRLRIIDELSSKINVKNVKTVHARAEELAAKKEHREQYDLCVSRAVANLATLSEYCLPFIKEGGYFMAYKGPDAEDEIKESKKAIRILGGEIVDIRSAKMEKFGIDHKIIIISKIAKTPLKYPRKAGTPAKEPIR